MAARGLHHDQQKSIGEVVNDLWLLLREYAKQETIEPLKPLARFMAWGVLGGVLVSLGVLFGALGLLRALQTQTGDHLSGRLNWIPYLVALVFTGAATALAFMAIKRPIRAEEKQQP